MPPLRCVVLEDGSELVYSGDCESSYDTGALARVERSRSSVQVGRFEERGSVWDLVHKVEGDWLPTDSPYRAVILGGRKADVYPEPSRTWGFDGLAQAIGFLVAHADRTTSSCPYPRRSGLLRFFGRTC